MNQPDYCPIPMPDGSDCWRPPAESDFSGVCTDHMRELVQAWVIEPTISRLRCMNCDELLVTRLFVDRLAMCPTCGVPLVCETWMPERNYRDEARMPASKPRLRTDVVYYIEFGDRVKIGTTANLPARMKQLPHDRILAIEPGDMGKEKMRHRMFKDSLIPGQQEWFQNDAALVAHVSALRAKFGAPMPAWRRWVTRAS